MSFSFISSEIGPYPASQGSQGTPGDLEDAPPSQNQAPANDSLPSSQPWNSSLPSSQDESLGVTFPNERDSSPDQVAGEIAVQYARIMEGPGVVRSDDDDEDEEMEDEESQDDAFPSGSQNNSFIYGSQNSTDLLPNSLQHTSQASSQHSPQHSSQDSEARISSSQSSGGDLTPRAHRAPPGSFLLLQGEEIVVRFADGTLQRLAFQIEHGEVVVAVDAQIYHTPQASQESQSSESAESEPESSQPLPRVQPTARQTAQPDRDERVSYMDEDEGLDQTGVHYGSDLGVDFTSDLYDEHLSWEQLKVVYGFQSP